MPYGAAASVLGELFLLQAAVDALQLNCFVQAIQRQVPPGRMTSFRVVKSFPVELIVANDDATPRESWASIAMPLTAAPVSLSQQ